MFRAADEPARSRAHRLGVRAGSMSAALMPPVPMTTSRWLELPVGSGGGAAPLVGSALLPKTASTRRAATANACSTCRRFTESA